MHLCVLFLLFLHKPKNRATFKRNICNAIRESRVCVEEGGGSASGIPDEGEIESESKEEDSALN